MTPEESWPECERDERIARVVSGYVLGTAQEWMRVMDLPMLDEYNVRVTWHDAPPGLLHLGTSRYDDDLGRYRVRVSVQALPPLSPLPPIGPENDPAQIEEMGAPAFDPDNPGCAPEACGGTSYDPCATVLRTSGAAHDGDGTGKPDRQVRKVSGTWFDLRPGDVFSWNGVGGEIETISIGDWNVRPGEHPKGWQDKPWKHKEVHVRLVGREGRMQIKEPNGEVVIVMGPERYALHELHRAGLKPEAVNVEAQTWRLP